MILLVIMCSSILQVMDVQSIGIVPCFNEAWKNSVNVGVSSSASVLSNLVGMWSGPVALCSLSVIVICECQLVLLLCEWVWANAFVWYGGNVLVLCEY